MTDPRFARHHRLPEVGEEGQTRLGNAHFEAPAYLSRQAAEIAVIYARAAGFAEATAGRDPSHPSPAQDGALGALPFRHQAAADVGEAAASVLARARQVLGLGLQSPGNSR